MKLYHISIISIMVFTLTYLYPQQAFKIVLSPELYLTPTSNMVPFNLEVFAIRMIALAGFVPYSIVMLKGLLFRQSKRNFVYLSLFLIQACFLWFEYMQFTQGAAIPGFSGVSSRAFFEGFAAPIIFLLPNIVIPTILVLVRLKRVEV